MASGAEKMAQFGPMWTVIAEAIITAKVVKNKSTMLQVPLEETIRHAEELIHLLNSIKQSLTHPNLNQPLDELKTAAEKILESAPQLKKRMGDLSKEADLLEIIAPIRAMAQSIPIQSDFLHKFYNILENLLSMTQACSNETKTLLEYLHKLQEQSTRLEEDIQSKLIEQNRQDKRTWFDRLLHDQYSIEFRIKLAREIESVGSIASMLKMCFNKVCEYKLDREEIEALANGLNFIEIARRDAEIAATNAEIARLTQDLRGLGGKSQRDDEIAKKDAEIVQKNAEIAGKDAEIARKDAEIAGKDAEIARKDAEIAGKDAEIAQKDIEITQREAAIANFKAVKEAENKRIVEKLRALLG